MKVSTQAWDGAALFASGAATAVSAAASGATNVDER
jgi:hypothetical protein